MTKRKHKISKHKLIRNLRPGMLILVVPVFFGVVAAAFLFSTHYQQILSQAGAARLTTKNWELANASFNKNEPTYERKFAYYTVQPKETLAQIAAHYSVSEQELAVLNPGSIVAGTSIKIPPVEQPLKPLTTAGDNMNLLTTRLVQGTLYVDNTVAGSPQVTLTIPLLMDYLKQYNAIQQVGPKQYRLLVPLYIEGNIRIDITGATVSKLELKSGANYDITTLTFRDSAALIEDTDITTFDPATNLPDTDFTDGRSFVRAYGNGRMDIIGSELSYLGMSLDQLKDPTIASKVPFISQGGIYGVSWRIPSGSFGKNIVTGWVQDSTFDHNHIGSFTFGASGMTWNHNLFTKNDVYGLDPHDDSNNALIENNTFANNGKHGFIVSKRCDYNIIRDNVSYGNKLHGFMLHESSDYNLIEDNTAYDNTDNYVIYHSSFNEIKNNKGSSARASNVRINEGSTNNYVVGNTLTGGERGVYLYGGDTNTDLEKNTIQGAGTVLVTAGAKDTLFINNTIPGLVFKFNPDDRTIFGPNNIKSTKIPTN